MNKSESMGLVLLILGIAVALTVGVYASSVPVLAIGYICVALLFYMGIGLYSRGKTVSGLLRESEEEDRDRAMYRTTAYISGLAALGGLLGFVLVTANQGSIIVRGVFAVIFLYNLPTAYRMWKTSEDLKSESQSTRSSG